MKQSEDGKEKREEGVSSPPLDYLRRFVAKKVYQRQSAALSEVIESMISGLMVTTSWSSLVPILV
jgi:hypothetical protein